jgi:hypothetical protein
MGNKLNKIIELNIVTEYELNESTQENKIIKIEIRFQDTKDMSFLNNPIAK